MGSLTHFLNAAPDEIWRISPSDLTFLWGTCHRCFWLKYVKKIPPSGMQMPAIFNDIDKNTKEFFTGKDLKDISPFLPQGVVGYHDYKVVSQPIQIGTHLRQCVISGMVDSIITIEDGSYGVIDFKTSVPDAEHTDLYHKQLSAYTYALEHPEEGSLHLEPVSLMGILAYEPATFEVDNNLDSDYKGKTTWIDLGRDDNSFVDLIDEVLDVLEGPLPPKTPTCSWCKYQTKLHEAGII